MTHILGLLTEAYGGRGGIAQAARDFVEAVAARDNATRIDLVVRLAPDPPVDLPAKVTQLPARFGRIAYALTALAAARLKPDLIYCNHLYMAPLARILARLVGARLAIQLHGVEVWSALKPHLRRALEAADIVLCVSRDTRRRALARACLVPEKVIVLNNTVGDHFRPGDRCVARTKFALGQEIALLTVGRLSSREQYKGHEKVLAILPNLKSRDGRSVRYLIAGDGDDRSRLECVAQDLGLASRVTFLGHVAQRDLPDLYRAADLFVMPSEGEGFGIAFLEAMSSGTPAIGLAAGGAADALGDGDLGSCIAPADMLETIDRQFARLPHDPAELSVRVQRRFGRYVFQTQVATVLDRLMSAPRTIYGGRP